MLTCSLNIVKGLVGIKGLLDELRKIVLRERERDMSDSVIENYKVQELRTLDSKHFAVFIEIFSALICMLLNRKLNNVFVHLSFVKPSIRCFGWCPKFWKI